MTVPTNNSSFNDYFAKIKCEILLTKKLSSFQQLEYLNKIFLAHVRNIPFHNFELRQASHAHPLNRQSLTLFNDQFIKNQNGGFCFQTAELLFRALEHVGFEVHRSIAKVLHGLMPNAIEAKKIPATHLILVVKIDDQQYLLDPSMGMIGHYVAFLLQNKEVIYKQNNHLFKIQKSNEEFILSKQASEGWETVMHSTLLPADEKLIMGQLRKLERFPQRLGIRDVITLVGIATETGGKSLLWNPTHKQFSLKTVCANQPDCEEIFTDINRAFELLTNEFKITHISQKQLIEICGDTSWPQPTRSLEVNFPIDQNEINQLRQCFRS